MMVGRRFSPSRVHTNPSYFWEVVDMCMLSECWSFEIVPGIIFWLFSLMILFANMPNFPNPKIDGIEKGTSSKKRLKTSGQMIIFHQPRFPGIFLPTRYLLGAQVAIIWPENHAGKCVFDVLGFLFCHFFGLHIGSFLGFQFGLLFRKPQCGGNEPVFNRILFRVPGWWFP